MSQTSSDYSPSLPSATPWVFFRSRRSRWREYGRPAVLFLVTAASIAVHGAILTDMTKPSPSWHDGLLLVLGVCSIMLAHEFGHYVACRCYAVDATLPHFIPAPPIFLGLGTAPAFISFIGTFGAFIRIRGPIPNRRALFDIGVAGPLAGFVVTVIVLALAIVSFTFAPQAAAVAPAGVETIQFSTPPLFWAAYTAADHLMTVHVPAGMTIVLNPPLLMAAWFGAFLTALNLMPVGQLDGGHAVYALLRRQARAISRVAMWATLALLYFSPTWLLWTILLRVLGRPHPPTLDDEAPVGRVRVALGVVTLLVFALCFMPIPIAVTWPEFLGAMRSLAGGLLHFFHLR